MRVVVGGTRKVFLLVLFLSYHSESLRGIARHFIWHPIQWPVFLVVFWFGLVVLNVLHPVGIRRSEYLGGILMRTVPRIVARNMPISVQ